MCDYSLHTFPNRLAREGEELVVHRFGGASLGLAAQADVCPWQSPAQPQARLGFCERVWRSFQNWLAAQQPDQIAERRIPAICVPPGAKLLLRGIPTCLRNELKVAETEEVKFTQISTQANSYRDAICFENGAQIKLQRLQAGQRVTVISLGPSELQSDFGEALREAKEAEVQYR